ncbi:MAG: preprotein translocase subunit SecE [Planctomycetes bacterium]|nr:preprotein translocase subunit SecE [Planctomycetota bacterium]
MLFRYKPDDGRNARQIAFWFGEAAIAFGCTAFAGLLDSWVSLRGALIESTPKVPVFGVGLTGSFVGGLLLFLVLSFFWVRFLAKEKIAQHLIEVEAEINKVTWPTFKEASNSSIVVLVTVIVLMGFLALIDFVFGQAFDIILWS